MGLIEKSAKDIIFREGDKADGAYIVKKGAIEILKRADHGDVQLAIIEEGEVFGEMALLEARATRSATARALTDSTIESIGVEKFKLLMEECPPEIRQVILRVTMRLRETNQRLAAKERATVILDSAIEYITIHPTGIPQFGPIRLPAANIHYVIGGYPKTEEAPNRNDLDLPCDGPPLMISQKHCALVMEKDGLYVVDLGSRFCTIVNGKVIGRAKISEKAPLQLGENKVTLGDHTSPYKLIIICE